MPQPLLDLSVRKVGSDPSCGDWVELVVKMLNQLGVGQCKSSHAVRKALHDGVLHVKCPQSSFRRFLGYAPGHFRILQMYLDD